MRFKKSYIAWSTVVIFGLLIFVYWTCHYQNRLMNNRKQPFEHRNLRQLQLGLEQYHYKHGVFPFHPAGSDHALYLLNEYVDESALSSTSLNREISTPYWDHENKVARNAGWEYVNKPDVESFNVYRIILVSKVESNSEYMCLSTKGGLIDSIPPNKEPQDVLGYYLTGEREVVRELDAPKSK